VGARALGLESSDLSLSVTGTLSNLGAVVSTEGHIELDVDVVASLALAVKLSTSRVNEGGGAAIVVWGIVATSHEDDYIGADCVELGSGSLGSRESGDSAKGDGVADVEHDELGIKYVCLEYRQRRVCV
jgi:hypothetical protein